MIRQTSMQAFQDIQEDSTASTQRGKIFHIIKQVPRGLTRQEISRLLSIQINAVCGRVRELIKKGLIFEKGKRPDKFSGKDNYVLIAVREYYSK